MLGWRRPGAGSDQGDVSEHFLNSDRPVFRRLKVDPFEQGVNADPSMGTPWKMKDVSRVDSGFYRRGRRVRDELVMVAADSFCIGTVDQAAIASKSPATGDGGRAG